MNYVTILPVSKIQYLNIPSIGKSALDSTNSSLKRLFAIHKSSIYRKLASLKTLI